MLLGDLWRRTANRGSRGGRADTGSLQEYRRFQFPLEAFEPARIAFGFCRGRRGFSRDAGGDPQSDGAADAWGRAARLGRGLVARAACGRDSAGLSEKVRHLRRTADGQTWIPPAARRIFSLARSEPTGRGY